MLLLIFDRDGLLIWGLDQIEWLLILISEGLAGIYLDLVFLFFDLRLLLLFQYFLLPLAFLALSVVLGEVAVLAHALGVVELVGVLACPCLLRLADPVPTELASFVSSAITSDLNFFNITILLNIVTLSAFFKTQIILTGVRLLRLL